MYFVPNMTMMELLYLIPVYSPDGIHLELKRISYLLVLGLFCLSLCGKFVSAVFIFFLLCLFFLRKCCVVNMLSRMNLRKCVKCVIKNFVWIFFLMIIVRVSNVLCAFLFIKLDSGSRSVQRTFQETLRCLIFILCIY